jgi:hypothetical protein
MDAIESHARYAIRAYAGRIRPTEHLACCFTITIVCVMTTSLKFMVVIGE